MPRSLGFLQKWRLINLAPKRAPVHPIPDFRDNFRLAAKETVWPEGSATIVPRGLAASYRD